MLMRARYVSCHDRVVDRAWRVVGARAMQKEKARRHCRCTCRGHAQPKLLLQLLSS